MRLNVSAQKQLPKAVKEKAGFAGEPGLLLHIVVNIAIAAPAIITAVVQPSHLRTGGLTRSPMIFLLLVSSTTKTIKGGARTPFSTADQNNIFTALKPA